MLSDVLATKKTSVVAVKFLENQTQGKNKSNISRNSTKPQLLFTIPYKNAIRSPGATIFDQKQRFSIAVVNKVVVAVCADAGSFKRSLLLFISRFTWCLVLNRA